MRPCKRETSGAVVEAFHPLPGARGVADFATDLIRGRGLSAVRIGMAPHTGPVLEAEFRREWRFEAGGRLVTLKTGDCGMRPGKRKVRLLMPA